MSFLRNYLEYAKGNEAPAMFHVWCAYGCLSAGISRRVWMRLDDYAIYCNLYVLLVGGAGNGKSVCLQKAKRIISECNLPFSGSVETPQGLWRFMTGDSREGVKPQPPYAGADQKQILKWPDGAFRDVHPMNIIANELVNFISLDDKGWINALNDIYDEDVYHYRTKNMGTDLITGPYITLIGALTTQVSASMQKDQIINTGLARRTLFQFGERDWYNPHPNPQITEEQKALRNLCVEHVRKLRDVSGEFLWTPETNEWWHAWYGPNLASVPKKPASVQGWFASKSTQLMKLAMLTSLSERSDLKLEPAHFEVALSYLNILEKDLFKIFGGVGKNDLAEVSVKIYNHIALLTEPVSLKVLKIRFFQELPRKGDLDKELTTCLGFLVSDGKLEQMSVGIGTRFETYYATPEVMQAFREQNVGVTTVPAPATPPVLRSGSASVTGPSISPPQPHSDPEIKDPRIVQSPSERTIVPPRMDLPD